MWTKLKNFPLNAFVKRTHPHSKCNQYSLQGKHTKQYVFNPTYLVSFSLSLGPICVVAVIIAPPPSMFVFIITVHLILIRALLVLYI
jgi:hypothetical protein